MLAAALAFAQPAAHAQASSDRRILAEHEAADFRGVGRVNIAGSRFCTGTLISDRLVLTAAHCLYNPRTRQRVPLELVRFVAGLRLGAHAAARRVVRAAVTPGYEFDGRASLSRIGGDLALLELDQPIPVAAARSFPVDPVKWVGGALTIVSYAHDRAHAPSIQHGCDVQTSIGVVAALDCEAKHGASGSPIFVDTIHGPRVVGIVSAMKRKGASPAALVVMAKPALEGLQTALYADPVTAGAEPATRPPGPVVEFVQSR